jgi:hypothetical protein
VTPPELVVRLGMVLVLAACWRGIDQPRRFVVLLVRILLRRVPGWLSVQSWR